MTLVHVLTTGGTIASLSGPDGRRAAVPGDELLATISPPPGVELRSRALMTRPSFGFGTGDLLAIARAVRDALADGADGVVVAHGTDVMEETAFLTDLTHDDPRPVVFTGAQRPADDPAPDGPANLADAIRVAADPIARSRGVLVVFDGVALPAFGVTKIDTLSSRAFANRRGGPALRVAAGRVVSVATPERPALFLDPDVPDLPRVDVVALYAGADTVLLTAAVEAGARGIVLAALGAGNATPAITAAVADLIERGVPVLVCSRVPNGPAVPLYTSGGGSDLAGVGAVFGGDLSPWQGRLLLAAAIAARPDDPAGAVREALKDLS
ncbi:asparaginase [Actinoallomurus vinaceus]|uniref:asparaginase n=1 Tax=Actinoallomurus vinaceus TaxID=1080074 RepID=A0ABP8UFQ9_9ACTN